MTDIKKVATSGGDGMAMLQARRRELMQLAQRHGVRDIRVFGSVARGEDRPDSDIDLLVGMEDKRDLFDLGGFQVDVSELLGKKVDVLTDGSVHRYIRDQVLKEAKPL